MITLGEVQASFRDAVLPSWRPDAPAGPADLPPAPVEPNGARPAGGTAGEREARSLLDAIADDAPGADARLRIYAHHVTDTLTDVLAQAFPVVRQLVGAGFFAYAADAFIRTHPPTGPCLFEFGDRLADFLAGFPACRHLAYLPDVARLEWAMQAAMHADDAVPLAASALATLPAEAVGQAVLRLDPSLALIESPWPVDAIWRAHQPRGAAECPGQAPGQAPGEARGEPPIGAVDLAEGPARIEVRRLGDDVVFRVLDAATFVFRATLGAGHVLEAAADAALAADPAFDLPGAIRALFAEGAPVGLAVRPDTASAAGARLDDGDR